MYNKKVLKKITSSLDKAKKPAAPKDIIVDPKGQWNHPGEVTRIPASNITMQGVNYPVMGVPNIGMPVMMYPGQDYDFPNADYVDEYPQMQDGGYTDAMNGMMKARLAYANEFGNPAAQRMINLPDNPYQFDNGDTGTHYMASMDNYAVPQIQDEDGQLMLGDYGPESDEAMRFESDEDADYFAKHYKDVSPGFMEMELSPEEIQEYAKGGYIIEDVSVPELTKAPEGMAVNPLPLPTPAMKRDSLIIEQAFKKADPFKRAYLTAPKKDGKTNINLLNKYVNAILSDKALIGARGRLSEINKEDPLKIVKVKGYNPENPSLKVQGAFTFKPFIVPPPPPPDPPIPDKKDKKEDKKKEAVIVPSVVPAQQTVNNLPDFNGLIEGPRPDKNTDPRLKHIGTENVTELVDPEKPYGPTRSVEKHYYKRINEEESKQPTVPTQPVVQPPSGRIIRKPGDPKYVGPATTTSVSYPKTPMPYNNALHKNGGELTKAQDGKTVKHTDKKGNTTITVTDDDGTQYIKVKTADGKVYNKTIPAMKPMSRDEFMQTDYYNQRNQFPVMNQKSETLQNSANQKATHLQGIENKKDMLGDLQREREAFAVRQSKDQIKEGKAPRAAQDWKDKVTDIVFNPMTAAGHWMRGQEVPDYLQESLDNGTYGYWANGVWHTERNPLDAVTDIATPIGALHAAKNITEKATDNVDGNFWTYDTALDALDIIPTVGLLGKSAKKTLSKTNDFLKSDKVYDFVKKHKIINTDPNLTTAGFNPLKSLFKVDQRLAEIEKKGLKTGLSKQEISKQQLKEVGITTKQREGYTPILNEILNAGINPYGSGTGVLGKAVNLPFNLTKTLLTGKTPAAQNLSRNDAWRLFLGKPQKNNTFSLAETVPTEGVYKPETIENMEKFSINKIHEDPQGHVKNIAFGLSNPSGKVYPHHYEDFFNKGKSIYPRDTYADIMGGFNSRIPKENTLEYNDIWDLGKVFDKFGKPFLSTGQVSVNNVENAIMNNTRGLTEPLENKIIRKPTLNYSGNEIPDLPNYLSKEQINKGYDLVQDKNRIFLNKNGKSAGQIELMSSDAPTIASNGEKFGSINIDIDPSHRGKNLSKPMYEALLDMANKKGLDGIISTDDLLDSPAQSKAIRKYFDGEYTSDPEILKEQNASIDEMNKQIEEDNLAWGDDEPLIKKLDKVYILKPKKSNIEKTISNTSNFSNALNNYKSLGKEISGYLLKNKSNKKAIEQGNQWLQKWIEHPTTQGKIEKDLSFIKDRPNIIKDKNDYLYEQAKNFKPISKEYPLKNQIKNLESLHTDNYGVSYMHNRDPFIKFMYINPDSKKITNPYNGSWISRSPYMPQTKRTSTTIHEGTHDWVTDDLLNTSQQYHKLTSDLDPFIQDDLENWKRNPKEFEKSMGKQKSYQAYLADPTEQHARIMELRHFFKLTPDDVITPDIAQSMMDYLNYLPKDKQPIDVNGFFKILNNDPEKLSKRFNTLWGMAPYVVPTAIGAGAAAMERDKFKKGGHVNDEIELDLSPEEIKEYISKGYVIEQVH